MSVWNYNKSTGNVDKKIAGSVLPPTDAVVHGDILGLEEIEAAQPSQLINKVPSAEAVKELNSNLEEFQNNNKYHVGDIINLGSNVATDPQISNMLGFTTAASNIRVRVFLGKEIDDSVTGAIVHGSWEFSTYGVDQTSGNPYKFTVNDTWVVYKYTDGFQVTKNATGVAVPANRVFFPISSGASTNVKCWIELT